MSPRFHSASHSPAAASNAFRASRLAWISERMRARMRTRFAQYARIFSLAQGAGLARLSPQGGRPGPISEGEANAAILRCAQNDKRKTRSRSLRFAAG